MTYYRLDLSFFFFNDTATTEIYTLSLHDALPISPVPGNGVAVTRDWDWQHWQPQTRVPTGAWGDRKSTRLNSSHSQISYAVFCLKKNKPINTPHSTTTTPPLSQNSSCKPKASHST